jgi:hypothetical protein
MAINAAGMTGTVDQVADAQRWAVMAPLFRLVTSADLVCTVSTTTNLTINIASGGAVCCGIRADSTTATTVAVAANTSGTTRMDSIALVFDWGAQSVSFQVITGTSPTTPVTPTTTPGVLFQAVLAYVYVRNGVGLIAAADVVDVRAAQGLYPAPGVVARARRTTNPPIVTGGTSAAAQPVLSLTAIPVTAGRLYRITSPDLALSAAGSVTGLCVMTAELKYTTGGSTPTAASTLLAALNVNVDNSGHPASPSLSTSYAPAATGTVGVLLDYYIPVPGGANNGVLSGSSAYPIELIVEDIGADPGITGTIY